MRDSRSVTMVRLLLALAVFALGAIVITRGFGEGKVKTRVARSAGVVFVLARDTLVARITSQTPKRTRDAVFGRDVRLFCDQGLAVGQEGGHVDTGPVMRWPTGRPETKLGIVDIYAEAEHPVCGIRAANGAEIVAATF